MTHHCLFNNRSVTYLKCSFDYLLIIEQLIRMRFVKLFLHTLLYLIFIISLKNFGVERNQISPILCAMIQIQEGYESPVGDTEASVSSKALARITVPCCLYSISSLLHPPIH